MTESSSEAEISKVIRIGEAKSILPEFNGDNMPVTLFIKECLEIAALMNASDKNLFTKVVRSKIVGKAQRYVNSRSYSNLHDLLDALRRAYFPQIDYYGLQTELSTILQKSGETVSDYGLRVVLLLNKAVDLIIEEHEDNNGKTAMIESSTKNAVQCFLRGLRADIATFVLDKQFESLELAIDEAVRLEQKLNSRSKLMDTYMKTEAEDRQTFTHKQFVTPLNDTREMRPIKRDRKTDVEDEIAEVKPVETRSCYGCGEVGHLRNKCPYRQVIPEKKEVHFGVCCRCRDSGHIARNCPNPALPDRNAGNMNQFNGRQNNNYNSDARYNGRNNYGGDRGDYRQDRNNYRQDRNDFRQNRDNYRGGGNNYRNNNGRSNYREEDNRNDYRGYGGRNNYRDNNGRNSNYRSNNGNNNGRRNDNERPEICNKCNRKGHSETRCPNYCAYCKAIGHPERQCPRKDDKKTCVTTDTKQKNEENPEKLAPENE